MVNQAHSKKNLKVSPLLFALLVKVSTFFKVSFVVGSHMAMFGASSIIAPLAGAFNGIAGTCGVFGLSLCLKMLFGAPFSLHYLAFFVPGFFASLYWSSNSLFIRFVVPLLCMIAFIAHPAIGAGWVYSLYWLVPMTLYILRKQTIFFNALGSTLTAHAVGSVIWQYTTPMAPQIWLGLIPVVFVERMVFACGMVIAYHMICMSIKVWHAKFGQTSLSFLKLAK